MDRSYYCLFGYFCE